MEEKQMGIQPYSLIKHTQSVGHARTAAYVITQTYSQLEAAHCPSVRFAGASPRADVLWQEGACLCWFQPAVHTHIFAYAHGNTDKALADPATYYYYV